MVFGFLFRDLRRLGHYFAVVPRLLLRKRLLLEDQSEVVLTQAKQKHEQVFDFTSDNHDLGLLILSHFLRSLLFFRKNGVRPFKRSQQKLLFTNVPSLELCDAVSYFEHLDYIFDLELCGGVALAVRA